MRPRPTQAARRACQHGIQNPERGPSPDRGARQASGVHVQGPPRYVSGLNQGRRRGDSATIAIETVVRCAPVGSRDDIAEYATDAVENAAGHGDEPHHRQPLGDRIDAIDTNRAWMVQSTIV